MSTTPDQFSNIFVALLSQSLALGGTETEVYLSTISTLDGQLMETSDFSFLGEGILSVDVQSAQRAEFIGFTAVDPIGIGVTGITRGYSFKNKSVIAANKKFHAVGAPVIISFGTQNLIDLEQIIINNLATVNAAIAALTAAVQAEYLALNGSNVPLANIPFGGFRITGLGNGVNPQDAITFAQLSAAVIAGGVPATTSTGGYVKAATTAEFNAGQNTTVVGAFTFYNMATVSQVKSLYPSPNIQIFTTSGTWTKPVGVKYVIVTVIGAGGGGGTSGNTTFGTFGGGGGAINSGIFFGDLLNTISVTIGVGGAGSTSASSPGSDGTNSSFGSLLIANGGKGGPMSATAAGTGGAGGAATGSGIAGGAGAGGGNLIAGGAGGAGGGTASNASTNTGGAAGATSLLLGAGPNGSTSGAGINGNNYGSGGSGAQPGSGATGGVGAQGYVIVTAYF